jgi:hypothetical protein
MGGRSSPTRQRSSGTPQGKQATDGKAVGGSNCPASMNASIAGPTAAIVQGSWLDVNLDRSTNPHRAVLVDTISGQIVGALMGVPNLALLLKCLEDGVAYRAYVAAVVGGRMDVMLVRQ